MALLLLGESRWKIFKNYVFWIKVIEIILPLLMFPFCITFNDKASLHTKDFVNWLNITVKYPFKYYGNTTAVYTDEDSPLKFSFDEAIHICVQLFVFVSIVTMVQAIFTVVLSCVVYNRTQAMGQIVMYIELFSAIVVAFFLVVSTSLWLYNIFTLKNEIVEELTSFKAYAQSNCNEGGASCDAISSYPDYSTLFVSVGFGFVDFLVWLSNIVLIYRNVLQPVSDANGNNALIWAQELPEASASAQQQPN